MSMDQENTMATRYEREIPEGYEARIDGNRVIIELKDSEDERIRKYIVKFVELEKGVNLPPEDADKMLAYLERQKELAAIPDELVKNYKLFYEQGGRELALLINAINGFNKLKEQQPVERNEHERIRQMIENTLRDAVLSERISETSYREMLAYLEKQKEQKPIFKKGDKVIWDDEEFNILDVNEIEYNVGGYRVPFSRQNELHPIGQKPAEWSEEDEYVINKVLNWAKIVNPTSSIFEKLPKEQFIERLKSLRPQPHWKPSEEQMKALEEVRTIFHHHHLWDEINPILYDYEELMRDLQKLL